MSDRIHPPTPRKRKQARDQGRFAKSKTLVTAGVLLGFTALLSWWGESLARALMCSIEHGLGEPILTLDRGQAIRSIACVVFAAATLLLPMLVALMLLATGMNLLQTGLVWTPSRLRPSMERVSPVARLTDIFSPRSLGRFLTTALKLVAIAATAAALFRTCLPEIARLGEMPLEGLAAALFGLVLRCCGWMGMTVFAIAVLDYAIAWWQHEQSLRMTEQELREEMRDLEGGSVRYARSQTVSQV